MDNGDNTEKEKPEETFKESHDLNALRITHEEARAVINHQVDAIDDVDDKAAYSLRLNILLLGVLLTISSLMIGNQNTPPIDKFINPIVGLGVACSGLSIVTAIWAYTSTRTETGPGPNDIELLLKEKYDEELWLKTLIQNYANWMRQNAQSNRRDSLALFGSHMFLFLQMGYYALGIAWGLYLPNTNVCKLLFGVTIFTIIQLLLLFLPRIPYLKRAFEFTSDVFSKLLK